MKLSRIYNAMNTSIQNITKKTNDVKYPFLHFLFNLWRNAWFCLRIYDKMQMLHSNITKLIAQKEKRIVYL